MTWTFRSRSIAVGRAALVAAFFLVLAYFLLLVNVLPQDLNEAKAEVSSFGPRAPIAAILIQATAIVVFIPGILLILATAILFGPDSIWINLIGHCLGASCCFVLARFFGKDAIESVLGQRVFAVEKILEEHGFRYLIYMRFLAFIPLPLMTYGPGLVKFRYQHFLLATVIGAAPLIVVMAFFGQAIGHIRRARDVWDPEFVLPAALLVAFQGVPLLLTIYMRHRKVRKRRMQQAAAAPTPEPAASEP